MLRREVSGSPEERTGVGPAPGMSPAEILRDLQERQAESVITAPMPGPQAWDAYELPAPGGAQAGELQAVKSDAVTPAHAAAEGALDAGEARDGGDAKRRRRERVQHEVYPVDPYLHEAPEIAHADLPKAYDQAVDVPEGYPPLRPVHAEQFRRGPAMAGHAAYSPGYAAPGRPVPVPSTALAPGMVSRPLPADGRAASCAPEAC